MALCRSRQRPSRSALFASAIVPIVIFTFLGVETQTATVLNNALHRTNVAFWKQFHRSPEHVRYISDSLQRIYRNVRTFPVKDKVPWLYHSLSKHSKNPFLPTSQYDSDIDGAIELFDKHGVVVCRVYKVCRLQNGTVEVPEWMSDHATTLRAKCGLHSLLFKPRSALKSHFGTLPYYDWLGPGVPSRELLELPRDPLSVFFASRKAKTSHFDDTSDETSVKRTCLSPATVEDREASSGICSIQPEGKIAHPAFLVNIDDGEMEANGEFQEALSVEFLNVHGVEADVFSRTSVLLTKPKACFRSAILTPQIPVLENEYGGNRSMPTKGKSAQLVSDSMLEIEIENLDEPLDDEMEENVPNENSLKKALFGRNNTSQPLGSMEIIEIDTNGTQKRTVFKETTPMNVNVSKVPLDVSAEDKFASELRHKAGTNMSRAQSSIETEKNEHGNEDFLFTNGGVELFTHRALDTKTWNGTKTADALRNLYGVCRFHGACRTLNQTMVLPQWMEKHEDDFRSHCSVSTVRYVPDAEFRQVYGHLQKENSQMQGTPFSVRTMDRGANFELGLDLMGSRVYRSQEQHFMTDFFHDGIHAFDALFNQKPGRNAIFTRRCIYKRPVAEQSETTSGDGCVNKPSRKSELHPAVLMQPRTNSSKPSASYIQQLLAMMPGEGNEGPQKLYSSHLATAGPYNSTCFRSIVVTRNAYPPPSVLHRRDENVFFVQNNLSRLSVLEDTSAEHDLNGACTIRMTILSPREEKISGDTTKKRWTPREQTRKIENHSAVLSAIREQFLASPLNISLDLQTFKHDRHSLADAQRIVQASHILLGLNNPTMTSIAFARADTSIIEIQPFGYSTGPYRSFARSLHLRYHSLTSEPDEARFRACVEHNFRADWPAGVDEHEMETARDGLLRLFHEEGKRFVKGESTLELSKSMRADGTERVERIPLERVCARAQRMRVDANEVGKIARKDAELICATRTEKGVAAASALGTEL